MKLRPDSTPMIDLTRSLPTLQDSLTPRPTESSAAEDVFGAIILAALGAIGLALTFGL